MKYSDIKTKAELRKRIVDGHLSVGCHYHYISHLLNREPETSVEVKVTVIYSPGYGGTAQIVRYV